MDMKRFPISLLGVVKMSKLIEVQCRYSGCHNTADLTESIFCAEHLAILADKTTVENDARLNDIRREIRAIEKEIECLHDEIQDNETRLDILICSLEEELKRKDLKICLKDEPGAGCIKRLLSYDIEKITSFRERMEKTHDQLRHV